MTAARHCSLVACFLAALSLTEPVMAQSTEELARARVAAVEGRKHLEAREYPRALPKLEFAHRVLNDPSTAYDLMQVNAVFDKLVEAYTIGEAIQKQEVKPAQAKDRANVDEAMVQLDKMIPRILLRIQGAPLGSVNVSIDDQSVSVTKIDKPHRVNPGKHRVVVRAPNSEPPEWTWEGEVPVEQQQVLDVRFRLKPVVVVPPPPAPVIPAQPPLMPTSVNAGIGATVALGVVSLVSGVVAIGAAPAVVTTSCGQSCRDDANEQGKVWRGLMVTSTIACAAAVTVGVGTILHAHNAKRSTDVAVKVVPSLNGLVVQGRW